MMVMILHCSYPPCSSFLRVASAFVLPFTRNQGGARRRFQSVSSQSLQFTTRFPASLAIRPRHSVIVRQQSTFDRDSNMIDLVYSSSTSSSFDDTNDDMSNNNHNNDDTIFALSSGSSTQATAVAVIRLTGPQSANILQQLTQNKPLPPPRLAVLRTLTHPIYTNQPLDQALVLYFPQPHSFTGQDVVELHCHGSPAVLQDLLTVLSSTTLPARLAEPGEFTQRAFAQGKLNVLQIEGLADLLAADTSQQRLQALKQLNDKQSSQVYEHWRSLLIAGLAHAEAVIDFGDDEHLSLNNDDDEEDENTSPDEMDFDQQQWTIWGSVRDNMQQLVQSMQQQLRRAQNGQIIRQGLQIAILGPPNAGKSSLFNVLANRDAAIVSSTAGTTRDVLELALNLKGVKCILQDTAGVRSETNDEIERVGIQRAIQAAKQADMVLAMVDATQAETGMEILQAVLDNYTDTTTLEEERIDPSQVMLILNKSDLKDETTTTTITQHVNSKFANSIGGVFEISCLTQDGVEDFLQALTDKVFDRVAGPSSQDGSNSGSAGLEEGNLITRERHRIHVQAAVDALERFDSLSQQGTYAVDMAAEELRLAASELGRITGAVDVEDVLDKLFSDFCIGK